MPKRSAAGRKSRRLKVAITGARPFTAASNTSSSRGSRNCGRQRNQTSTGSTRFTTASRNTVRSAELNSAAATCSGRLHTSSYSMHNGTVATSVVFHSRLQQADFSDVSRRVALVHSRPPLR